MKRVLVACEYSGTVREAFKAQGWDAWSCDILPTDIPGQHIQGDVIPLLQQEWDLLIAFPPCTHLAVSGAAHFAKKKASGVQDAALDFVRALLDCNIPRIALENPVSIISSRIRKPTQIIQPWMFGHETTKATCLWLKNLPALVPTDIVSKGERQFYASGKSSPIWHAKTGGGCGKVRSKTFQGIANAMAAQWGNL